MPENKFRHIGSFLKKENKNAQSKGKNYLFAIAINNYTNCPKLFNPVKDAQELIAVLIERYGFKKENIQHLFNKEATEENIDKGFLKLAEEVTPDDNLIIFFSGHGEYDKLRDRGFWVPVDAQQGAYHNYISNSDIRDNLNAINSRHTFLIADSCFSGSLFATYKNTSGVNRLEKDPSRWGLTAGRNELVLDGASGENSPFANSLIYQLRKTTRPIGVSELCNKVIETVISNAEQTPRGEPLKVKGHMGGQLYFHPTDLDLDLVDEPREAISQKAEKLAKLERQRSIFKSNINEAERHFQSGDFKNARESYGTSITYFHSSFAPDLDYIEKRMDECSHQIQVKQLVEDGKKAFSSQNYKLALQYFEKASKIDNSAKTRDWIKNCNQKLNINKHQSSNTNARFAERTQSRSSKGSNTGKWIVGLLMGIFIIVYIMIQNGDIPYDDFNYQGNETTELTEPNILFENAPQKGGGEPYVDPSQNPPSNQYIGQKIVGFWMVTDILVNGYSSVASGTPIYENWDIYANGNFTLRNTTGTYNYTYAVQGSSFWLNNILYDVEYVNERTMKVNFSPQFGVMNSVLLQRV
ncbi:MAG: caspase family protein [Bacteroidetes bacterium]|jgi:tetratricopeptide (TPR) repeat protein|nr:caspase family protein [Bacteroidota bacterium]MDF1865920.1 caspase family protein [Saprospiraceae bacterium]